MLDGVGQGSQTAPTDSSPSNPSRKRSRDFFDTLAQLITKNVNKKPMRLPKRQPTESDLLAQYHASRVSQQQSPQRSLTAFRHSPLRKTAPPPSIFSPATSKMYASPRSGSAGSGALPSIPLVPLPSQQQGLFGRGLAQSSTTTPAHNRVNPPLSRLGTSRVMAQPTSPFIRMPYLNSAPAVGPSPAAASPHPMASTIFTPTSSPHHPLYDYDGSTIVFNTSPHDAQHDIGFDRDGNSSEDQRQDAPPSPGFNRMYGQRGFSGRQPEGFQNGMAEDAPSSHQAASKAPADSAARPNSQPMIVSSTKRLIAKNAALTRLASPAPSIQSPFQAAGLQHKAVVGSVLKRKASQALAEETWPKASRKRMETALNGVSKAEEAVQQASAAATTPSRPRPPTAVLGFAPPSPFSPATKPTTGKYSWPANFFDDSKNKKVGQAADSEPESAAAGGLPDESVDTSAISSHMGTGDSTARDEQEKDFGAAWRDAAQSPPPHQSLAPAPHNEDIPQVTSPPFATAAAQQQQQPQPMASTNLPGPVLPSQAPAATPSRAPPTAFARMFGTPQHTPAAPPLASMFAYAASPATVPVKSRQEGPSGGDHRQTTGNPTPAMFSAAISTAAAGSSDAASDCAPRATGTDAAAPPMRGASLLPNNQAAMAKAADSASAETLREGAAGSKPVETVKAKEDPSKPVANVWGAALPASNHAAAAKATEAVAEAAKAQEPPTVPVANGWGAALLASNQAAAAKATEAAAEAAKTNETQAGAFATAGLTSQATASNMPAAVAPAPSIKFGVPASAQAGWGNTGSTETTMPAVPVMLGHFQFGVIPADTTAQTASPPLAIPAAKVTAATPDGENSLGRDASWMSISPETCDFQQPTLATPFVPQPQQGNHPFGPTVTGGQPPFGAQPAAGLFGGLAGQSPVGPAQLSAFTGPSSNFTLGAAGNDTRPTSARNKRPQVLKGGKREGKERNASWTSILPESLEGLAARTRRRYFSQTPQGSRQGRRIPNKPVDLQSSRAGAEQVYSYCHVEWQQFRCRDGCLWRGSFDFCASWFHNSPDSLTTDGRSCC